jgi:hypothetical protein
MVWQRRVAEGRLLPLVIPTQVVLTADCKGLSASELYRGLAVSLLVFENSRVCDRAYPFL